MIYFYLTCMSQYLYIYKCIHKIAYFLQKLFHFCAITINTAIVTPLQIVISVIGAVESFSQPTCDSTINLLGYLNQVRVHTFILFYLFINYNISNHCIDTGISGWCICKTLRWHAHS